MRRCGKREAQRYDPTLLCYLGSQRAIVNHCSSLLGPIALLLGLMLSRYGCRRAHGHVSDVARRVTGFS